MTEPEDILAIAVAKLRKMVAASAAFQAAVGAVDATAALERVYLRDVRGTNTARPYAIVSMGDKFGFQIDSGGDQNYLRPSGSLGLYLAIDTPEAVQDDSVESEFQAWNFLSPVIRQIAELSNKDDPTSDFGQSHLGITAIATETWGQTLREQWQTLGRYYFLSATIVWGDD